ncbi:MAG TPA: MFS transporter, partial [Rhodanobacter sp.]|nr:MFS transporter [Rhodanobacter sp.]
LAAWFVLFTIGELYILPTGLALFGRMAPDGFRATSIATWFFAGFFGNLFAGVLGTLWSRMNHGMFFVLIGVIAGLSAVLLYMLGLRHRELGQVGKVAAHASTMLAH